MKKKLAIILVITLLFAVMPTTTHATENIFFTAINDTVLPLQSSTFPAWVGGKLYVPASAFDGQQSGVSLGVNLYQSSANQTVTIASREKMMRVTLADGSVEDVYQGTMLSFAAIIRNGRLYLPVADTCRFFSLSYSNSATDYGSVLRIKSADAVLSDQVFLEATSGLMSTWANEYKQSLIPTPPTPPTPTTPTTPPQPPEEEETIETPTLLALMGEDLSLLEHALSTLGQKEIYALFFLTPEQLEQNPPLVRQILGEGHFLGLHLSGESLDQQEEAYQRGNLLLSHIAHTSTLMVYTPHEKTTFEEGVVWFPTSAHTLSRLPSSQEGELPLLLDLTEGGGFSSYLSTLIREEFHFFPPTETALKGA